MDLLRRIWWDESGQDLAEYGLILFLIVLAASFAAFLFGGSVESLWSRLAGSVSDVGNVEIPGS